MTKIGSIHIGTAGWSIASSHADAFPGGGSHLERYARQLNACEINSSFYRPHRLSTYQRWAASVPLDFRFSVKLPKAISHDARLLNCDAAIEAFLEQISGLGDRLGVILIQLPPSLAVSDAAISALQALAHRTATPIALESRHLSWFTAPVTSLMSDSGIALVIADPAIAPPIEQRPRPRLAYFRLHGTPRIYWSPYDDEQLRYWTQQIDQAAHHVQDIWVVFDNTAAGHALPDALRLQVGLSRG